MFRILALRNPRKDRNFFQGCQKFNSFTGNNDWALMKYGSTFSVSKLFSKYLFLYRGNVLSAFQKAKNIYWSTHSKQCAQVSWKRLYQMCSDRVPTFPLMSKLACPVSFTLTKLNLAPRILALIIGEVAWSQRAQADGFSTWNAFQSKPKHCPSYLTLLILLTLEGLILFLRAIYLVVLLSPALTMAPFVEYCDAYFRKMWLRLVHLTLKQAGPAFIKWGQWAATRPDLFPKDLCVELAKLQTKASAHSFSYTKKTIEKAFNRKLSDIFNDFEEEPVASGSVAQVHRASLRFQYPGRPIKPVIVAVKVRHPGVGESIRRDFLIINFVAKLSNFLPTLRWLRLDESVQQFAVFMMSQVDLSREAASLSRFIYNFRRCRDVSFPMPVYPLVHPAVLVESYEHGESISHYVDELQGNTQIKSALADIGTNALLKMLLVDNFIHADLHPGNILVRVSQPIPSSKHFLKSRPHVIFLDVGMAAELSKGDRLNLLEFFKAVSLRDGQAVAKCTLRLSKQQNCPNPKAFIEDVEKTFSFWDSSEGASIHPAECMQQLLEQVRCHKVNIDGDVCAVMVTTLVLEGWQRKLDPRYNVMQTLQTLLFKADWVESLLYTMEGLMAP